MSKDAFKVSKSILLKPTTAPASPENGEMYLDSVSGELMKWNGTVWEVLGEGSSINGKTGDITISAGTNVTVDNTNPNEIIINSTATGGASTLQEAYDNSAPPSINLTPNGPIEIFDPGVAGGRAFSVATVGGAFEVRDSELSYTGPYVLLNDASIKGVKNPIEWDNATNRDYVDNRSNTNFILNGTSESGADGWMTYANTAQPRPVDGTGGSPTISFLPYAAGPLSGNVSFLLDKPSGDRQGQGVSYDFTIDSASQAKVLKISFDYAVATGTFVAGTSTTDSDVIVYLYDITNARLIEPSSIKLLSNATSPSDTFQSTFQTSPDSVNYRLIFHIASSAGAPWALKIDNVKVERSQYVYGTPITDWKDFTASGTWITNTIYSGKYRQVGDTAEIRYTVTFSGSPGTGNLHLNMPPGLSIDLAKMSSTNTIRSPVGFGEANIGGTAYAFQVNRMSSTAVEPLYQSALTGAQSGVTPTTPVSWTTGNVINFWITVPIAGWSSSVQVSDGYDGRIVAGAAYRVSSSQTGVNPNNSQVKIQINGLGANNLDTVAGFDFINNRYVVKSSGMYRINGGIAVAPTNVLANTYTGRIVVNGTTAYPFSVVTPTVATTFSLTGSVTINLNAGDYVELFLFGTGNNSTNTLTVASGNITNLTLEKLSGSPTISMTETVGARATTAAGQSIPNATATKIVYGTETYDTHNAWDTTLSRFVAPYPGLYRVTATSNYNSTTIHTRTMELRKNGVAYATTETIQFSTTSAAPTALVTDTVFLNAGDYVEVYLFQNTGSSVNLVTSAVRNYCSIEMVK